MTDDFFAASILVMSDSAISRQLLMRQVGGACDYLEAAVPAAALRLADRKTPDAAILYPTGDPFEAIALAHALRKRSSSLIVLLMTNVRDSHIQGEAYAAGVDDVMVTPVDCCELQGKLRALLRRKREADRNRIVSEVEPLAPMTPSNGAAREVARGLLDPASRILKATEAIAACDPSTASYSLARAATQLHAIVVECAGADEPHLPPTIATRIREERSFLPTL